MTRRWMRAGFWVLACLISVAACSRPSPVDAIASSTAAVATEAAPPPVLPPPVAPAPVMAVASAAPAVAVRRILEPDTPIDPGDYVWNVEGAPDAATQIIVDLAAQRIYVYRGTTEIGRSSINFGADNKPTPTGTFRVLQKKRHHISNLYGAPMPYMLRLTMDGIAIHGSPVEEGAATHGCIGLPDAFAALLFAEARIGTRVVVTNGGDVRLDA